VDYVDVDLYLTLRKQDRSNDDVVSDIKHEVDLAASAWDARSQVE